MDDFEVLSPGMEGAHGVTLPESKLHVGEKERALHRGLVELGGMAGDELAVRFAAFAPGVSCAVVGTTSLGHLRDAAAHVAKGPLTEDVRARIAGRYEAVGREWPGRV